MAILFGFGTLFYVVLLGINSIAILNEDRFLAQSKSIFSVVKGQGRVGPGSGVDGADGVGM